MVETLFCVECGSPNAVERVAPMKHKIGKREVIVENDRHLWCDKCGNVSYLGDMLEECQRAIADTIRREDHLLTPDELKVIRQKYGLTQAEMEKLLTIGPKTWVRWERGKVVQSAAADQMIRLIASNPTVLRGLLGASGIKNDCAEAALNEFEQNIEKRVLERVKGLVSAEIAAEVVRIAVSEVIDDLSADAA